MMPSPLMVLFLVTFLMEMAMVRVPIMAEPSFLMANTGPREAGVPRSALSLRARLFSSLIWWEAHSSPSMIMVPRDTLTCLTAGPDALTPSPS